MIYIYECCLCGQRFDIIKSYKDIDNIEFCPKCQSDKSRRIITGGTGFIGANDWDTAHFSHVLGRKVNSFKEEQRLARQMGCEEIGNEPVENVHKYYESRKQKELDQTYEKGQDELRQIIEESRTQS
jgi:putative FmdB family regulatory protein